jgi:hypothetical protein
MELGTAAWSETAEIIKSVEILRKYLVKKKMRWKYIFV